ncbi:hypothetical protein ACKFKF_16060 [Phormidesmis sp. 146-12]
MSAGSFPAQGQNWLDSSVQEFFKTCNWDDHSIAVQDIQFASLLDENISLELTLSVGQFFAAVNWEGASFNKAPLPIVEAPIASDSDGTFTLTDFSDLFG